jgi:uncharacterized HAD superfamily protein
MSDAANVKKPIIAIDIDDVLAAEAAFVIAYSNQHWNHRLTVDDYQEFWEAMWSVDHDEAERRSIELHAPGVEGSYEPLAGACAALERLRERFNLAVVTSRREMVRQETLDWLDRQIGKDVFSQVVFTGIWDTGVVGAHQLTKTEILRSFGVSYLVDDQLKHCRAAAESGVRAVLFGNYPWNQADSLPDGVVRCADWAAVEEYFDGLS